MGIKKHIYVCFIIIVSLLCGVTGILFEKIETLEDEINQLRNDMGQLMGPDGDM
jgi:hypothetical protein